MSGKQIALDPKSGGVAGAPKKPKKSTFGGTSSQKDKKNVGKKVAVLTTAVVVSAASLGIAATIVANVTNKAKKPASYTVSLQAGGDIQGLNIPTITLKAGATVQDIAAPKVAGYYFAGYYSNEAMTEAYKLDGNTTITESSTIYLHYVLLNYNITASGDVDTMQITMANGDPVESLIYNSEVNVSYKIKKGHHLTDFSVVGLEQITETVETEEKDGTKYSADYKVVGTGDNTSWEDVNLAVNYTQDINTYTITYLNEDGSVFDTVSGMPYHSQDLARYCNLTAPQKPANEKFEYYFDGWVDENDSIIDWRTYKLEDDIVVKAHYSDKLVDYVVELEGNAATQIIVRYYMEGQNIEDMADITEGLINGSVKLHYEQQVIISYVESTGYHKNSFLLNGKPISNNQVATITQNLTVTYDEAINFYSIGEIPDGVDVYYTEGDRTYKAEDNQEFAYGTQLTINVTCLNGYKIKTLSVFDGQSIENGTTIELTQTLNLIFEQELDEFEILDFETGHISITYQLDGQPVQVYPGDKLLYGTEITIEFTASEGYHITTININGAIIDAEEELPPIVYMTNGEMSISFTEEINEYTVYAYNYDGTLIETTKVKHGQDATFDIVPTKASDGIYNYVFDRWVTALNGEETATLLSITADKSVYASYYSSYADIHIHFVDAERVKLHYVSGPSNNVAGQEITSSSVLYYGDVVRVTYQQTEEFELVSIKVNGEPIQAGDTFTVEGSTHIECEENWLYKYLNLSADGSTVLGLVDDSVEHLVIPSFTPNGAPITTISSSAFYNKTNLRSVVIGNNVTSIQSSAFYGCTNLLEVYNLSDLDIRVGVSNNGYVGYYAAIVHASLDEGTIYETIGDYLFYSVGDKHVLTGYSGSGANIVLPTTDYNYSIANNVFKNNKTITSVQIPDCVTEIGDSAFSDCSNLTKLETGDSITKIKQYAFSGCSKLTDIYLSAGLTSMESKAFNFYASNTTVHYGGEVADWLNIKIGGNAIPQSDQFYFNGVRATEVVIPDGVETIGSYQFEYFSGSISLPSSLTKICRGAFANTKPKSVNFRGTLDQWLDITFEDEYANPTRSNRSDKGSSLAFNGVTVTDIVVTNKNIKKYAFVYCSSLKSVTISTGVTEIGESAFYNCIGLETITIGTDVTKINQKAFYYTTAVTEFNFNATNCLNFANSSQVFHKMGRSGTGVKVTIGSSVTRIPDYFFDGVGQSTTADSATLGPKLSSVQFKGNNVTYLGASAFATCAGLTSFSMPSSVTSVGLGVFGHMKDLKSISLSSKLTALSSSMFYFCTSLTTVTIPSGVTIINPYAFYNCQALTTIDIPSGVKTIGFYAFQGCTALKTIYMGSSSGWYLGSTLGDTSGGSVSSSNLSSGTSAATTLKTTYVTRWLNKK